MKSRVFVVFLLFADSVAAQFDAGAVLRHVRVKITFSNGVCDPSTRVKLSGRSGLVAEGSVNDRCEADFLNVPAGTYHLSASSPNFPDAESDAEFSPSSSGAEISVGHSEGASAVPASRFVSAADLGIPARAQKEFDKANESIGRQDWTKAIERLNHALAIYPAYAGAYNNLGVVYARLGDRAKERDALQKAISINDHFAPAYLNLGRMDVTTGDFPNAEAALNKATTFNPTDAMTLELLCYAEFMDRAFDQVIATSRKAHALQGPHAFVHQVAARAFEQKHDAPNAIAELEIFLKEEPAGPRADIARKELAAVQAIRTASVGKPGTQ